jgi:hypothetical protein
VLLSAGFFVGCGSVAVTPQPPPDAAIVDRPVVETDAPTVDVSPTPVDAVLVRDVGAPDVPAPDVVALPDVTPPAGPCEGVVSVTNDVIDLARIERVADGFVLAWAPSTGTSVIVQSFTEALTPRADALTLPLNLTNGTTSLTVSFLGDVGVVAAGSSFFFLARSTDGRLTLNNRHDYPRRLVRWAQVVTPTTFQGVLADGAYVVSNGTNMSANTPDVALSPPHGPGVSILRDATGGGYRSFETHEAVSSGRLHARRFIFGHGASLEVANNFYDGASASPVVLSGSTLYRLIFRGMREVDVLVERRDPSTLALVGEPAVLHAGAAWINTDGAIGAGGPEPFFAWSARPQNGGYNSALRVRWETGPDSAEVYRNTTDRVVRVFGASTDATASRAWVLFGERDTMGRYNLLGRCVARRR